MRRSGKVLLVGAGPGAADLLTIRALRAIESADVVLCDALVGPDIRALSPPSARTIDVGKRGGRRKTSQDFINRLMARLATNGAIVVRLKGGDPSIFGRVSEERAFLEALGIPVEIIPGVTAASAAAAQFGFSLSQRGVANRILFATARMADGVQTDWSLAADSQTTLCLYMGGAEITDVARRLMAAGRHAETPLLIARDIERPDAMVFRSTLSDAASGAATRSLDGPVFIAIGEACAHVLTRAKARPSHALSLQAC